MASTLVKMIVRRRAALGVAIPLSRTTADRASHALLTAVRTTHQPQRAWFSDKVTFTFIDGEGEEKMVSAEPGQTLLEVAHENDIELEGACGGELACSTCHLIFEQDVYEKLPEICEEEEDMLDLAWGLTDTSRLGCQIKVTKDLEGTTIRVPDESHSLL